MAEGVLHDITGRGHPSLALEVETDEGKKDEFLLENGVPKTVDGDIAHEFYQ